MKAIYKLLTLVGLTVASAQFSAVAQAIEVDEIVKKANHALLYQGSDGKAKIDMVIKDNQGRERKRQLTMIRKNLDEVDGPQKYYVYFSKPADIKKMVFMAWKNIDQDDDRWLYLPALDLVKRIAASDERTSFVGSHFFYEDVSGRNIDEDIHELIEQTDQHYVVKSMPKEAKAVEFKYYKTWVDKTNFLPVKGEYYNETDTVYRTFRAVKIETIQGYPTVLEAEMVDNLNGGKTTLKYSAIKYDKGIPEKIFTERYLRRAPKKYLR